MIKGIHIRIGIVLVCFVVFCGVIIVGFMRLNSTTGDDIVLEPASTAVERVPEVKPSVEPTVVKTAPLDQSSERVTKKPFGLRIDRTTSPVQPERFSGYHTGTDFETFPSEAMTEVAVRAICSGDVMAKRSASGYGGILVTSCVIDNEPVTVVYGHLRLSSISLRVGERVEATEQIGVLGTGGSSETDGERKHLHLGIHRGTEMNVAGYVADTGRLAEWIDPCPSFCQ